MLDGKVGAAEASDLQRDGGGGAHPDKKDWWLWRLGPEVGVRIPLGEFEPHFELGAGYATIGGTGDMLDGRAQHLHFLFLEPGCIVLAPDDIVEERPLPHKGHLVGNVIRVLLIIVFLQRSRI